jgi:hypothetical protein
MSTTPSAPSQAQIEAAVEQTLVVWGAELDAGQKFWWMDWNRMIRDAITAMRTGEPVLYDDGAHNPKVAGSNPAPATK